MQITKPSLPSGFRDFGPGVMRKRKWILKTIELVFLKFGFECIETPTVENLSTLLGKYGEDGDQLVFKILNSGDFLSNANNLENTNAKELLPKIAEKGLRYDLTVPMSRFVSSNRHELPFPFKRYQMQTVWRADRPQKGRYREFMQCDADIVGSTSIFCDLELLNMYDLVFQNLNLPVVIRINHRALMDAILLTKLTNEQSIRFMQIIDKFDKIGDKVNDLLLTDIGNSAVDIWQTLTQLNKLENLDKWEQIQQIFQIPTTIVEEVNQILNVKLQNKLVFDLSLARGLSYYTGIVFEVIPNPTTISINIGSIGGGGRYNNLTKQFGLNDGEGVGISFGLDRIYDVLSEANLFSQVNNSNNTFFVCCLDKDSLPYAYNLCLQLRTNGLNVDFYPKAAKLAKMLDYANSKNAPFAGILGSTEIENNAISIKNLTTGEQQIILTNQITKYLKLNGL